MKKFLIIFIIGLGLIYGSLCFALSAPSLEEPQDIGNITCGDVSDEEKVPLRVNLKWSDVGAESYEIRYVQTATSCDAITKAEWTELDIHPTKNSYDLAGLSPDKRYCWKVKAERAAGDSNWSSKRAFCTEKIDSPDNGNRNGYTPSPTQQLINPLFVDTLCELLNKLINFLFILALGIAPIVAIVAGIYMLNAEPEKVKRAKQILLWAAIALTIVFLAKGLPSIIKGALGG